MFSKWKQSGNPVKWLRMDNAGENKKLEERMNGASWKLDIDAEYTAASTPQQNHLAELSFHILANRGRALMHRANVPIMLRYKLYREALTTVTQLDWLEVITLDGVSKTRYQYWSKKYRPKICKISPNLGRGWNCEN